MFDHMVALQDIAFEAIKPGARCSDVDRAVRAYFDEHDLWDYWSHHVGHCIGLRYHEGPFLDIGDDTEIRPGNGVHRRAGPLRAGLGGFRHSDTVVVTDDGIEFLTYYPRDLESLTLPDLERRRLVQARASLTGGGTHACGDAEAADARERPTCADHTPARARRLRRLALRAKRSTKAKGRATRGPSKLIGGYLLSREVALRVPSAQAGLTSLFGMGRGVSLPL